MKKTLALLLTSSALLMACGAEEPEATEDIADESVIDADSEAGQQVDEPTAENVEDSGDEIDYGEVGDEEYFSIHYFQGNVEVENILEDASDIAGLHQVTLPDEYRENRYFPLEAFIDIKEDGRATVLSYEVVDVIYDAETDTYQDEYLNAYIAENDLDEWSAAVQTAERFATNAPMRYMYIDKSNSLKLADGPVPINIEMATGYMVKEYGEIEFRKVEQADVRSHLDENGVLGLSSLMNSVDSFVTSGEKQLDAGVDGPIIFSPLEYTFETSSYTEVNYDAVLLPFLLHKEGLRSVSQVWSLVGNDHNERVEKAMQTDAFADDPVQPYVTGHNELMHFLFRRDGDFSSSTTKIADDPSQYIGYTQDNTEIVPDMVFVNENGDARTMQEDGTIWKYNSENGTWDRAEYPVFW